MSRVKLTTAAVLKYAAQRERREIGDTTPGLVLVIQPSGAKSWAMRFRRPDGRPTKLTLGPLDSSPRETADEPVLGAPLSLGMARELANRVNRERARGIDVVEAYKAEASRKRNAAADAVANTFAGLVKEFFVQHRTKWGGRPRRWRDDARLLGLRWPPGSDPAEVEPEVIKGSLISNWAARPIAQIDAHDIIAVIDDSVKNGIPGLERGNPGTSAARGRKVHAALSGLFRWAQQRRKVTVNPCVGIWHPGAPPSRDRVLDDDEIKRFWQATETLKPPYGVLLRFLLLTGLRRDEASKIRHDEIDEAGLLIIPKERAKNHVEHKVPLPPLALELLHSLPRLKDLVFGDSRNRPPQDFSRVKAELDVAMGDVPPWRVHDLRRSCASGMQALGIRHEVIEKALNHSSGVYRGVGGTYQRAELLPERREALLRWANHIEGLVSDRPKVAQLEPRRGAGLARLRAHPQAEEVRRQTLRDQQAAFEQAARDKP
jgi:integrase